MLKFNIVLLFLFVAGLPGCIKSKYEGDGNESPFLVDEIEGTLSISAEMALPEKFTLQLKTCVRLRYKIETMLPNTKWAISHTEEGVKTPERDIPKSNNLVMGDAKNEVIKVIADGNGCLKWTEEYDYAHSRQSRWIIIHRYIRGFTRGKEGVSKIPLAVNPWLQLKDQYSNVQVADYRDEHHKKDAKLKGRVEEDGLKFLEQKKKEEQKHRVDVVINELELHLDGLDSDTESGESKTLFTDTTISAELKYSIQDVNGKLWDNIITQGDFQIKSHLLMSIAEDKKKKYMKINENGTDTLIKTRFESERLASRPFDWIVPYISTNDNAHFRLYIKVIPIGNTAKRVNPFEGLYYIADNFKDVVSGNIKTLEIMSVLGEKYRDRVTEGPSAPSPPSVFNDQDLYNLKNCLTKLHYGEDSILQSCISPESPDAQTDGVRPARWAVTNMAIRFFGMERENWLFRNIKTQVKTSVVSQKDAPISAKYITIKVIDLSTGEVQVYGEKGDYPIRTEDDGAIFFNIYTKQKWYNRQRYFLKIIQFETRESSDLKAIKMVAINPWDYGFTHGFEVNNPDQTRATCLEGTEDKALLDLFSMDENQILNIINQEKKDSVVSKYTRAIRSLFCDDRYKESKEVVSKGVLKPSLGIGEVFHKFRETLIKISSFSRDRLRERFIDYLKKGFTSLKEIKRPIVQIHLFRSVNKYPTYLIDSSLRRELYYNIRVKLTPRVVRHDDIARGQQNKGPLRDGVYIFQMAVLKNDQGKFHGRKAMVNSMKDFWDIKWGRSSTKAGTLGVYNSCPIDAANCITVEDFIVPPTNIPVLIRDGMMKTDVHTYIKREHLLFANSKNLMVFRLLPADPASIICKDGSKTCTMRSSRLESYEDGIDWSKEAIKKIKAADLDDYDMFLYTYKVPFIPSLWTNWTITHELEISFDDLVRQYNLLSAFKALDEESKELSNMMAYSRKKYAERKSKGGFILPYDQYLEELVQWQNTVRQIQDNIKQQIDQSHGESEVSENELKAVLDQIKLGLENHRKRVTEDSDFTAEQQTQILERLQETEDEINNLSFVQGLSFIKKDKDDTYSEGDLEEPLLTEGTSSVTTNPYYLPIYDPTDRSCVEADFQQGNGEAEKAVCLNEEKSTEDLLQRHKDHFASVNNLCTINLDSRRTDSACGSFSSNKDLQSSFIKSLNKQIQSFNEIRSTVIEKMKSPLSRVLDSVRPPEETPSSHTAIEDSFEKINYYDSVGFIHKIKNMPQLQTLDKGDLKDIIELDDISKNINNKKTGAFIYALCGLWFENFLSNEYINENLFLNGLRQAVKRTFYYQLRKIYQDEEENGVSINTINTNIASTRSDAKDLHEFKESVFNSLKDSYDERLRAVRDRGAIDDLYNWVDSQATENYGFDSEVIQKWRDKLKGTSLETFLMERNPLVHHKPSWVPPDDYMPGFDIENYLSEARVAIKRRNGTLRVSTDYHPVRKCINNPTHFFGFEKKFIVGKMDGRLYGEDTGAGGEPRTLSVSKAFLMNTQRDQGANQGFNVGVGNTLSLLPLLMIPYVGIAKAVTAGTALLGLSLLAGSTGYDYRMYEGTGKRRWLSIQVIETVDLIAEHTPISMTLTDYHQCLVVRPRFSAFSPYEDAIASRITGDFRHIWKGENHFIKSVYERMGILLCTPGTEDKEITEDYYYIYPRYPINGVTMDISSHRNKPFAISLRGKNAYNDFVSDLSCYTSGTTEPIKQNENCRDTRGKYENLFLKHIEFADNLKEGFDRPKLFHLTGDSPGVYSPYVELEDRDIHTDKKWYHKVINWFSDWKFMDADLEKLVREEPQ